MATKLETNKDKFLNFLKYVNRPGKEKLIEMLNRTDFFTAPASTKYHLAYEGGLVEHTLNVYDWLIRLIALNGAAEGAEREAYQESLLEKARVGADLEPGELQVLNDHINSVLKAKVNLEGVVIAALCHDFHKINFYTKFTKRVKTPEGNWVDQEAWTYREDHFVLGEDGTNSWYIANSVMPLKFEEIRAIENHMGSGKNRMYLAGSSETWAQSRLSILLHMADLEAAFIVEVRQ